MPNPSAHERGTLPNYLFVVAASPRDFHDGPSHGHGFSFQSSVRNSGVEEVSPLRWGAGKTSSIMNRSHRPSCHHAP